jgi:hypothetical protein
MIWKYPPVEQGSMGVALVTTLLAQRSQIHRPTLTRHPDQWRLKMAERLRRWTNHFVSHGADTFTAALLAMAMRYRETVKQANIPSYADDFWLPLTVYCSVFLLIPFMHRVRSRPGARARRSGEENEEGARDPCLAARAD